MARPACNSEIRKISIYLMFAVATDEKMNVLSSEQIHSIAHQTGILSDTVKVLAIFKMPVIAMTDMNANNSIGRLNVTCEKMFQLSTEAGCRNKKTPDRLLMYGEQTVGPDSPSLNETQTAVGFLAFFQINVFAIVKSYVAQPTVFDLKPDKNTGSQITKLIKGSCTPPGT